MSPEEQSHFWTRGMLFPQPDSSTAVSSGIARDWPDARGLFASETGSLWAWVNEEDHLRLHASETGSDLGACCSRLCRAEATIRSTLAREGHSFACHARYGYLTTGLASLGTAMCVTVLAKLPLVSAQPNFRSLCKQMRLHASYQRGLGAGVWLLSNMDRMGCSEVDQVQAVAEGCRQLVGMEMQLEYEQEQQMLQDCILAVRLRTAWDVEGVPTLSACTQEQRREVESTLAGALLELPDPFAGDYYPLPGSSSYAPKPEGMGQQEAALLQQCGLVLDPPEGLDQGWPDARGVFASMDGEFAAYVNRLGHLSLLARVEGGDAASTMERLSLAEVALRKSLEQQGRALVGAAALSVRVALPLPKLVARGALEAACKANGLVVAAQSTSGIVEVASLPDLGVSEDELVEATIAACGKLVAADMS